MLVLITPEYNYLIRKLLLSKVLLKEESLIHKTQF